MSSYIVGAIIGKVPPAQWLWTEPSPQMHPESLTEAFVGAEVGVAIRQDNPYEHVVTAATGGIDGKSDQRLHGPMTLKERTSCSLKQAHDTQFTASISSDNVSSIYPSN